MENITVPDIFASQNVKRNSFNFLITIVENVKYSKVHELSCECFCEPVYFEGNSTGDCDLMLKDAIENSVKLDFKLHNIYTNCYRFQFAQNKFLTFIADKPNHFIDAKQLVQEQRLKLIQTPDWDETYGV